ncbi:MAG: TetR/AcrR family transcriptional regulator, partial [Acidobacteria bacterium]|nr:TetR/AcrR family transcriptional regulator [Acidobacteriota bacterium]
MARTSDKREKLVAAAKALIHRQGLTETSLADIARASKVPLGNIYYYFKTKDDIGSAVIGERLSELEAMQNLLDSVSDPKVRLHKMLDLLCEHRKDYAAHGCP